jgi:predicted dehydrogenase
MRTHPNNLFVKKAVEDGLLGDISLLRVRNAHNGASGNWLPEYFYDPEQACGGAMMDLGAHPMYLVAWILGRPVRVTSLFNTLTGKKVEDNAVSLIEFENKALAISETGFVTGASPFSLEIYGTEGAILHGGPDNSIRYYSTKNGGTVNGWITPASLPKPLPGAMDQWLDGIANGTPIVFGLEDAIGLSELMEAAYLSEKEKRTVRIDELKA